MRVYDVCDLDDGKPQNYLFSSVKSMCGEMPSKQYKRDGKEQKVTEQKSQIGSLSSEQHDSFP